MARKYIEIKWKYGLTPERYVQMLAEQDHRCAICRIPFNQTKKGAAVDHDHDTGAIRGLLCGPCNTGLEVIERPGFVEAARVYLNPTPTWRAA